MCWGHCSSSSPSHWLRPSSPPDGPRAGGIYAWVEQAFGDRSGFLAVWFEWVENIVWFPTVLSFVAATLAYVIDPSLADNKLYLVIVMLTIFWALTIANFFGIGGPRA